MASATAQPKADDLIFMKNSPEPAELEYAATMDGLRAALGAIEQACNAWKIGPDLVSRALIVVEELFSNTIKYGYGGECARPVRLRLTALPFTIVYEDDAPGFDPTHWKSPDNEALALDERPEGRAGIAMVMGLCGTVYEPRPEGNRLVMTFRN
jgi:anti-sigma regulatory factor (Ser/Thr protein kinase)